jgi:lipase ATG15
VSSCIMSIVLYRLLTFPQSFPFGWDEDDDGFRGHVFTTADNSTVVISIKGTSAGLFGGGGPTARKDKLNDNLLFSCCCARVDFTWSPVCGCHAGGWKCDRDCLESSLIEDSLFYPIGTVRHFSICRHRPDSLYCPELIQQCIIYVSRLNYMAYR